MTVKDYILKKCSWFYKFKNIFHKHVGINLPLIIESRQPLKCDGAVIDENDLKDYDLDFDQDLEDFYQMAIHKTKREEDISVFFANLFDLGSCFNLNLHFALSQIA